MNFKLLATSVLVGLISGCGGGGGGADASGSSGGSAALDAQSAAVAANSLETLEQPVAMTNFIISVLHQLSITDGVISGDCQTNASEAGTFSAQLTGSTLSLALDNCDITGKEQITGEATVTFDHLSKHGQYLEFAANIATDVLEYDHNGQRFTVKYDASITQALMTDHNIKLTARLNNDEAITVDGTPIYFHRGEIVKELNYLTGSYSAAAHADITAPQIFDGTLSLRTSSPLQGTILQYPTAGKYTIYGANGSYASVSPGSTRYWAKIEASGSGESIDVSWSDMTSGAIMAFPSRRAVFPGEFGSDYRPDEQRLFVNQSPNLSQSAQHPLQPEQTVLIIPAPQPEQLADPYFYNRYDYSTVSPDNYVVTTDGPWVTVKMLKDLPVDADYMLEFPNLIGGIFTWLEFNTHQTFEISVTEDQIIEDLSPFTLKPVDVTGDSSNYSVAWSQIVKDHSIEVNQISPTEATIDPSMMLTGEIYKFQAQITDPYNRVSTHVVSLMVEDPVKGRSFVSYDTDQNWRDPNQHYMKVIESNGYITSSDAYISNLADSGYNLRETFTLQLTNMTHGYVYKGYNGSNSDSDFYFSVDGNTLNYNCMKSSVYLDVLEDDVVVEGVNSETGAPNEYHKLAANFTITCDSGTLNGKIRSNSHIE
ncbi:hypothetical protein [Vibrio mediterranei]|uniref:hypothetical protein n=1 Tax=Vibrio mediterranei TaxID=689 RepID=UPI004068D47E